MLAKKQMGNRGGGVVTCSISGRGANVIVIVGAMGMSQGI